MDVADRMEKLRRKLGWSQAKLAERSKVSLGVIKKLATGGTARMESYHKIAQALGVETVWFVDPKQMPTPDTSLQAETRQRTFTPFRKALMPEFWRSVAHATADEELDADAVLLAAKELDAAYVATQYKYVASNGPALLSALSLHRKECSDRHAKALAVAHVVALDAVGRYLSEVQSYDLAWLAAHNGLTEAEKLGDEELISQARSAQALILIRLGNFVEVEQECSRLAHELEPRMSDARPTDLATWGRLLNWAAAAASRNNRPIEAAEYVSLSHVACARLHAEVPGHTTFGPVSTAVQEVENALLADKPDEALAVPISEDMLKQLNPAKRNFCLLDRALAAHRVGNQALVADTFARLQRDSADWLRHSAHPRVIMREIITDLNAVLPEPMRRLSEIIDEQVDVDPDNMDPEVS